MVFGGCSFSIVEGSRNDHQTDVFPAQILSIGQQLDLGGFRGCQRLDPSARSLEQTSTGTVTESSPAEKTLKLRNHLPHGPLWVPLRCSMPQGLNSVDGADGLTALWLDLAHGSHRQRRAGGGGREVGVFPTHPFVPCPARHGWAEPLCLDTPTSCA